MLFYSPAPHYGFINIHQTKGWINWQELLPGKFTKKPFISTLEMLFDASFKKD